MATPNIVPRADGEGGLGTSSLGWGDSYLTGNLEIQSGGATTLSKIVMGTNANKATIGVSGATDTFFTGTGQGDLILRADDNNDKIHLGAGTSGIAAMVVTEVSNVGKVGIGTASPGVPLEVLDSTATSATQGGNLRLSANDGAVMASGHRLGVLEFAGAEDAGGSMTVGARIEALTDATWSASENGASLKFYTTDGNASQSEVLKLESDGKTTCTQNRTTAIGNTQAFVVSAGYTGDAAQDSTGMHLDFDRAVASSGTAVHNDVGLNLDVSSASLGTSTLTGIDLDVVGGVTGAHSTAHGIHIDVSDSDVNHHIVIGSDADGADRTILWGHSTLKTLMGIDDSTDAFVINTDGTFDANLEDNAFSIDSSNNVIINGQTTCRGNMLVGNDTDGADRTVTFGHSTIKTTIGIDDDQDVFAINTDNAFEADNDLEIDASGNVICRNGSITGANYRTIWVDAGSMVPTGTNGATAGTEEVTNTFDFFAFDTTTAEKVQFKIVMPEQWDVSADLKAKFYFLPTSTDTGTVQFSIAGTSLDTGDIISTAMGTAAVHTPLAANGTDNDVHITAATAACTIAGVSNAHEIVLFEITRVTGTDTFTGDAHLLGVNLQYKEKPAAESAW